MAHRPDRRAHNIFELCNLPVTFKILDFTHTEITIPANSRWRFPSHWHLGDQRACHRITNLQGHLKILTIIPNSSMTGDQVTPPGECTGFRPGHHHAFESNRVDEELVVLLETDHLQTILFRNTCSAILDAEQYPNFASTPCWVHILYRLLGFSSTTQHYFIRKLSWIQIQMMRSTHDSYFQHGRMNVPYLWWLVHPWNWDMEPRWTYNIKWWSYTSISISCPGYVLLDWEAVLGYEGRVPEVYTSCGGGESEG